VAEGLLLRPDGLPVTYCPPCGLWYVCETPEQSAILKLYEGYWQDFRPHDLSSRTAARMLARAKIEGTRDIRIMRLCALLGGLRGKRILDVGCGLGQFLLEARAHGAEVLGIDVSPEACQFVRQRLGLPVSSKPVEQWATETEPVDAVVMNDLIEHVNEPLSYIIAARAVLRLGGVLLLHTPNGGAAGDRASTARKWVGFRVDLEHLQYFSPRTIQCLARERRWEVEHLETLGFPSLGAIERSSRSPGRRRLGLRRLLKSAQALERPARAVRAAVREFLPPPPELRQGSYHLFCILRKPSAQPLEDAF